MKKPFFLILISTLFSFALNGQVTLTIVIKNLESDEGRVLVDFRDGNNKMVKEFTEKIRNKQCTIAISGLKSGKYSFKYFHDKNNNKKLDTYWIGAPKEGFGFSNNAMGKFGPPDFKKTIFELKKDVRIECFPRYIKL